jgi:cytochrome c-type biogenesis protein CcmH
MRALFFVALLLFGAAQAQSTAVPTEDDPVSSRRAVELGLKLRCLVCQNQSIEDSHADLAADLRRQIREQIKAGKSDREIIQFMTDRYGDFVLYEPPFKATTLLLWAGPGLLLVIGAIVMARVIRTRRRMAPAPLSEAERARADALLAGKETRP